MIFNTTFILTEQKDSSTTGKYALPGGIMHCAVILIVVTPLQELKAKIVNVNKKSIT
jgi:hypothetical protein